MANMKHGHTQSFKTLNATFQDTEFGKIKLELAVGQEQVLTIDRGGIKGKCPVHLVRKSVRPLVAACREYDEPKFNAFCDALDKLGA